MIREVQRARPKLGMQTDAPVAVDSPEAVGLVKSFCLGSARAVRTRVLASDSLRSRVAAHPTSLVGVERGDGTRYRHHILHF